MDKKICYSLGQKFANDNNIPVMIVRRRNCYDFCTKLPKGCDAEATLTPEITVKKTSKKDESIQ